MRGPRCIDRRALILLHAESLTEHGGPSGIRDSALLELALARPLHIHAYESKANLASLAAAYGFGIVRNHPVLDGNKRAAFLAIGLFLSLNGYALIVDPLDAVQIITRLAAGDLSENALADWIREHTTRQH
jgi:death-on-curing protein